MTCWVTWQTTSTVRRADWVWQGTQYWSRQGAHLGSAAAVDEFLGQVFEEPGVRADARDGDAVAGVGLEDLGNEVHALS